MKNLLLIAFALVAGLFAATPATAVPGPTASDDTQILIFCDYNHTDGTVAYGFYLDDPIRRVKINSRYLSFFMDKRFQRPGTHLRIKLKIEPGKLPSFICPIINLHAVAQKHDKEWTDFQDYIFGPLKVKTHALTAKVGEYYQLDDVEIYPGEEGNPSKPGWWGEYLYAFPPWERW